MHLSEVSRLIKKIRVNCVYLFVFNLFVMLFLMVFSGENYQTDSYGILLNGSELHVNTFIGSYRFFGAFLYYLLSITGHIPFFNGFCDVLFFIVLSSLSVTCLVNEFYKVIKPHSNITFFILDASILISILNVWFCNLLSFPECIFITAVGVALCFTAVMIFVRFNSMKSSVFSIVSLLLATAVYQQFFFMFIIYIFAFLCIKVLDDNMKTIKDYLSFIKRFFFVVLISGILYMVLSFYIVEKFNLKGSERLAFSLELIIDKVFFFIEKQKLYLSGRGFYDSKIMFHCFLIFFVIAFFAIVLYAIKEKKYVNAIITLTLAFLSYVVAYIPGIITDGDGFRQLFALYTMFFVISCVVLICFKSKKTLLIFLALLMSVLFINVSKIVECENCLKKVNAMDSVWAELVVSEIEEYEKESGKKIYDVAFCNDMSPDGNDIRFSYTESVLRVPYARKNIILLKSKENNMNFNIIEMPENIYHQFFEGQDWDRFVATEQIFFVDSVAYICCY